MVSSHLIPSSTPPAASPASITLPSHSPISTFIRSSPRSHDDDDACHCLFGATLDHAVSQIFHLTLTNKSMVQLHAQSFIFQLTLFVVPSSDLFTFPPAVFRASVTHLIEMADSSSCSFLVMAINKHIAAVGALLRAFSYFGFVIVSPSAYGHTPSHLLIGYTLDH
ncbi:hypothetical protein DM01DRAFT_1337205 [Hesseltinella vesiculosa]|uniref:Uncharacterized protein n=1 Tax=Hesseltinella vesiculosa TaxID=101127 RepID=A0A1X2GE75_9FUNG|nr:hypothetical protein DM01DRAFT_1337205 [Hesseltinella vesiculosa]